MSDSTKTVTGTDHKAEAAIGQQAAARLAIADYANGLSIRFLRAIVKDDVRGMDSDSRKVLATVWQGVQDHLSSASFVAGMEKDRDKAASDLVVLIDAKNVTGLAILLRVIKPKAEKSMRDQDLGFANLPEFKERNKPIYRLLDAGKNTVLKMEVLSERQIIAHAQDCLDTMNDKEFLAEVIEETRGIAADIETAANCGDQLKGGAFVSEVGMVAAGVAETAGQFKTRVRGSYQSGLGVSKAKK